MAVPEPLIEIIIPNWNGKELLAECLHSLSKQTRQEFCVTVVDNGSVDGSISFLEEHYPEVKCLRFPENRGFSVAVNEGIRHSEAPWVFLLNNDIEVAESCIEALIQAIEKYNGYDFFALRMMSYHQRNVFDGAGDAVLRGGVGYRLGTLEENRGQYDGDCDVFGVCAGAALYSRNFFETVGLFDEDFFAYLEDVDLNMRARKAGLRCRYIASAVVYHIGSATSGSKINPLTIRLSTKNNINILVKNYPLPLLIRFLPVICIYQLMWFAFVLKKKQLPAYLKGLWQGLKQFRSMHKKRIGIDRNGHLSSADFALLLTESEQDAVRSIMARRCSLGKGNMLLEVYSKLFL